MALTEKQRAKVIRLMHAHTEWLSKWEKVDGWQVYMVSPRGGQHTIIDYQFAVSKHLNQTVDKIAKAIQGE